MEDQQLLFQHLLAGLHRIDYGNETAGTLLLTSQPDQALLVLEKLQAGVTIFYIASLKPCALEERSEFGIAERPHCSIVRACA